MSNITNIDSLVEDFIHSAYKFKRCSIGHDLIFRKDSRTEKLNGFNGMEIITELNLIFCYDALKSFNLINKWAHTNPDIILFEFWRQDRYRIDLLPDYMKKVVTEHNYEELYQDFYFDMVDS